MIIVRPSGFGNVPCFSCGNQSSRVGVQGLRGALGVLGMIGDGPTTEEIAMETAAPTPVSNSGQGTLATEYSGGATAVTRVGDIPRWYGVIGVSIMALGAGLAGYHGYKRSGGKMGSTLGWGFLGALVPIITVPVALAQGYGKRRG